MSLSNDWWAKSFIFLMHLNFVLLFILLLTFALFCDSILKKGGDCVSKICCFTGHRNINSLAPRELEKRLENKLIDLIENEGFTDFRAGGARGFDTMAAMTVIKLKKKYPHIKLHLLLPCKNQDVYFLPFEKQLYRFAISEADSVTYIQERYSREAMFARNRALVDGSDLCIAYLEKLEGGTYYTVNYARKQKVKAINLYRM